MAIQEGIIKVRGAIDNGVGYKVGRQYRFRKKARQVKRSEATKLAATDFGTASKAGKIIRRALKQGFDIRTDNTLTNRMNTKLLPILYTSSEEQGDRSFDPQELGKLAGFQFNKQTDVGQLLPFHFKVKQDGNKYLRIALPAITAKDIRHAGNTTHIEIKAIAVGVNFKEDHYDEAVSDKVLFDFKQPAEAKELVLPFKAGKDETIVVLQITAYRESDGKLHRSGNKKYFAADIIDVIPSLQEEEEKALVHHTQHTTQPLFKLNSDHTFATPQRE